MNENQKNKQKIELIDRASQYRLIIRFVLVNILILSVFGGLVYVFSRSEISANSASALAANSNAADMLLPNILTLSLLNILITSFIIGIVVVYWSQKIADPLLQFKEAIKEIKKGNLNPLNSIREDDQLSELSLSVQLLAEKFSRDISGLRNRIQELKTLYSERDMPHELQDKLSQMERILMEYKYDGSDHGSRQEFGSGRTAG